MRSMVPAARRYGTDKPMSRSTRRESTMSFCKPLCSGCLQGFPRAQALSEKLVEHLHLLRLRTPRCERGLRRVEGGGPAAVPRDETALSSRERQRQLSRTRRTAEPAPCRGEIVVSREVSAQRQARGVEHPGDVAMVEPGGGARRRRAHRRSATGRSTQVRTNALFT